MNRAKPVHFPAQCKCGHLFLEKYQWGKPQNDKGLIGFAWCGFCRTRENVYLPDLQIESEKEEVIS